MDTTKSNARTAGLLYLLLVLVAPLRLVYIPNTLFVGGDIAATVANITASPVLFQAGMLADLFCGTLEVFLALALYRLFQHVDRRQAITMVVLGLMPVPLYFVNVLTDVAVSHLLHGASPLAGFSQAQVMSLVGLAMRVHDAGINALQIFWGAWLFPLALLVMRSGFLPRFVGVAAGQRGGVPRAQPRRPRGAALECGRVAAGVAGATRRGGVHRVPADRRRARRVGNGPAACRPGSGGMSAPRGARRAVPAASTAGERDGRLASALVLAPWLGAAIAIVQLAWEASHGGIVSHHLLARADLPAVSNLWGLATLPALGWLAAHFVRRRSANSEPAVRRAVVAFVCALILGGSLAAAFSLGLEDISGGLFVAAMLAGLVAPTYRAEYLFGFVIGMTWVVGPVLPVIAGTLAATVAVLAHFVLRPAALALYRKLRAVA